jgi:hypothetical protein
MLEVIGRMNDRVEAAESIVIAAVCLLRAGRYAEALETAAQAERAARNLSPHRRLHAASAQTVCLAPHGRLTELADATAEALELVDEEGSRTCAMGSLAVAGHALARYEALDAASGDRGAELVEITGLHRADSSFRYFGIELLRPFVGFARTRHRLDVADAARNPVDGVHQLRALLPVATLDGDEPIGPLADRARALARRACAPTLAWIADWAEAVRAGSLPRALAATGAIAAYGERYTAARLEVDALVRLGGDAAATAARLERMGALGSLAELSGCRGG